MQPYYYIHATRIIAAIQELLNDIPEIKKADPELLVYDVLAYIDFNDAMIKEAVGERIYNKVNQPVAFEVAQ